MNSKYCLNWCLSGKSRVYSQYRFLKADSHVRRKHKHKHKKKYVWTGTTHASTSVRRRKSFLFLMLALVFALPRFTRFLYLRLCSLCLHRTCEPAGLNAINLKVVSNSQCRRTQCLCFGSVHDTLSLASKIKTKPFLRHYSKSGRS